MIQWSILTTDSALSIHCSVNRMPTPPSPDKSPLQKNLYKQSFPVVFLVKLSLHLVSWRQHQSICLCATVFVISVARPFMVPSLRVPILKWTDWCGCLILIWQGPHQTSTLTVTLPSLEVLAMFCLKVLFDIYLIWSRIFMAGCPSLCQHQSIVQGNWVFFSTGTISQITKSRKSGTRQIKTKILILQRKYTIP